MGGMLGETNEDKHTNPRKCLSRSGPDGHGHCRIATEYVRSTKTDQLTYAINTVMFRRYFDTDSWYYLVTFKAVVAPGDHRWQLTAPYATLLAAGQYPPSTNMPPSLGVAVLLSGEVVAPVRIAQQPASSP